MVGGSILSSVLKAAVVLSTLNGVLNNIKFEAKNGMHIVENKGGEERSWEWKRLTAGFSGISETGNSEKTMGIDRNAFRNILTLKRDYKNQAMSVKTYSKAAEGVKKGLRFRGARKIVNKFPVERRFLQETPSDKSCSSRLYRKDWADGYQADRNLSWIPQEEKYFVMRCAFGRVRPIFHFFLTYHLSNLVIVVSPFLIWFTALQYTNSVSIVFIELNKSHVVL